MAKMRGNAGSRTGCRDWLTQSTVSLISPGLFAVVSVIVMLTAETRLKFIGALRDEGMLLWDGTLIPYRGIIAVYP